MHSFTSRRSLMSLSKMRIKGSLYSHRVNSRVHFWPSPRIVLTFLPSNIIYSEEILSNLIPLEFDTIGPLYWLHHVNQILCARSGKKGFSRTHAFQKVGDKSCEKPTTIGKATAIHLGYNASSPPLEGWDIGGTKWCVWYSWIIPKRDSHCVVLDHSY